MNDAHTSGRQRRSELTELRRDLRDKQSYLDDDSEDLWVEISQWLLRSYNAPVGSLRTMVRSRLAELQEDPQHKMYDHPDVDRGEEAFPDDCKGCPHYGVQCPVLARYNTKQTYERIFDESEDDDELQGRLSELAANNHCHVIQNTVSEWESGYAQFLAEGERLRVELSAEINGVNIEEVAPDLGKLMAGDEEGDSEPSLTSADGNDPGGTPELDGVLDDDTPPEEAAERIDEVTERLMQEEDEEAEA